jgi:uncharacterized protein YcbK (DUF882 family)
VSGSGNTPFRHPFEFEIIYGGQKNARACMFQNRYMLAFTPMREIPRGQRPEPARSRKRTFAALPLAALLAGSTASAQAPRVPDPAVEPPQPQPSPPPAAAAESKPAHRKPRAGRGCRMYAPPSYRQMIRRWLTVPPIPKPKWRDGFRDLTLYSVNVGERIRVFPVLPDGSLDPVVVDEIARVMRDKDTDAVHAIAPRLIRLVYKLATKFNVRQITIISGYRQPKEEEGGGHHADGTAIDLTFSGVRLPVLAQAARRLGHVGVGLYPTAGFIHLDVRESRSYFWVDRSGPGQPGCARPLDASRAFAYDGKWRPELDAPVPAKTRKGALLGATAIEPAAPAPAPTAAPEPPIPPNP